MKNILYLILIFSTNLTFSQNFEGQITYKTTIGNPNNGMFTDSIFKEKIIKGVFGEQGFMLQKYFYKGNKYMSEISSGLENGFEVYIPEKKKIYAWKANSKEAVVKKTDEHPEIDAFVKFIDTKEIDTILKLPCKKILIKSKMGTAEFWYNSDYLKVNAKDYAEFKLDHKHLIYEKYGCLPFRIRIGQLNIEVVDFKSLEVPIEKFELPEFESEMQK